MLWPAFTFSSRYLYSFSDNYQQLVGPSWVIIGNWWGKISRVVRWILETYENMKGGPARRVFLSSSYIFSYLYLWIYIWYIKISKWYYFQFFPGISIRIDTNRGVGVPFFLKILKCRLVSIPTWVVVWIFQIFTEIRKIGLRVRILNPYPPPWVESNFARPDCLLLHGSYTVCFLC